MKKLVLLFLLLTVMFSSAKAQTFVQIGNGTDIVPGAAGAFVPLYRASSNSGTRLNRGNMLITATELNTAGIPTGATITAIAFEKENSGATVPGSPLSLTFLMANSNSQPPLATTTLWTDILATHTLVYQNSNATIPGVPGWVNFSLTQTFTYTGAGLEIASENQIGGSSPYASDKISWFVDNATAGFVVGVTGSSAFGNVLNNTTNAGKRRANVRIFYTVPLARDLRIDAILSPVAPVVAGSSQLPIIDVFNAGTNAITAATVNIRVNNGPVQSFNWTGNLAPTSGTQISFPSPITMPLNGAIELLSWISNVNNQGPDLAASNDSLRLNYCVGLPASTYTVGTPTADFTSLQQAIDAVTCSGILGNVTLQLAAGNYTGVFQLGEIIGAGTAAKLTISGASQPAGSVRIYNNPSQANAENLLLTGTQFLRLENITLVRTSLPNTNTAYVINMSGGAAFNEIVNCAFIDSFGVVEAYNRGLGINASANNFISGNTFEGFAHPIYGDGGAPFSFNNLIQNNNISKYKIDGIYLTNQDFLVIRNNIVRDFSGTTASGSGIQVRAQTRLQVYNNRVNGAISRYPIYIWDTNGSPQQPNRVYNNIIAAFQSPSMNSSTAILSGLTFTAVQSTTVTPPNPRDYLELVNNTVLIGVNTLTTNALTAAFFISGGSSTAPSIDSLVMLNNMVVAYPTGINGMPSNFRAFVANVPEALTSATIQNNLYHLMGTTQPLLRVNSPAANYDSLPMWRAAFGFDTVGLAVNPVFANLADPLPTSPLVDDKGVHLPWLTTDINGNPRDFNTPDIGAYEFTVPLVDLAVEALTSPTTSCGLDSNQALTLRLRNFGSDSIFGATLHIVLNGQLLATETLSDTLAPNSAKLVQLQTRVNMFFGGIYRFRFYATQQDFNAGNDTLSATVANVRINIFPTVEDFEAVNLGIPTFENGWTTNAGTFRWFSQAGPTATGSTGPNVDRTTATNSGRYLYTESSSGGLGANAELTSPCLDLTSLTQPMLEFWYHAYGVDINELQLFYQTTNLSWLPLDTLRGQRQSYSNDAWKRYRKPLPTTAIRVKFVVIRGNSFEGDFAIDDIRFASYPDFDVSLVSILEPVQSCALPSFGQVKLVIRNDGLNTLAGVPVAIRVNQGSIFTYSHQSLQTFSTGAVDTVTFSTSLNWLPTNSVNIITAYTDLFGDPDPALDTLRKEVIHLAGAGLPYNTSFETAGEWFSGGINSSWARGVPNATLINTAAAASQVWATNLSGNYNLEERSWLQSPCFDFSRVVRPELSFRFRSYMTVNSGANITYSINGGQTWQLLGRVGEGNNWYSADSVVVSAGNAVWTGNQPTTAWLLARLSLAALRGQSNVMFRFNFLSNANNIRGEGFAIDELAIINPTNAYIGEVSFEPSYDCNTVTHHVAISIPNDSLASSAAIIYRNATGLRNATATFSPSLGAYTGTIPRSGIGEAVEFYAVVYGVNGQQDTSALYRFVDGAIRPDLGPDRNISPGTNLTLLDGYMYDNRLEVATGGTISGGKIRFEVEARRTGLLTAMDVRLARRNTVNIRFGEYFATVPAEYRLALAGTKAGALPDPNGLTQVTFTTPLLLVKGKRYTFEIETPDTSGLLLGAGIATSMVAASDSNAFVYHGQRFQSPNTPAVGFAIMNGALLFEDPLDSVVWVENNIRLGNGKMLALNVTQNRQIVLEIHSPNCSLADTVNFFVAGAEPFMKRIISPVTNPNTGPLPYPIEIEIGNRGAAATVSFNVAYRVNTGNLVTNTVTAVIQPGDSARYTFTAPHIFIAVANNLCVWIVGRDTLCQPVNFASAIQQTQLLQHRAYPNPADTHFELEWEAQENQTLQLEVTDALGRIIFQRILAADENQMRLETSRWPGGWYAYRIISSTGAAQGKFVVRH